MEKPFVTFLLLIGLTVATMGQQGDVRVSGYWVGEVMRNGKVWRVAANISENGSELRSSVDFIDLDVIDIPFPTTRTGEKLKLERPQPTGNPIVFDGTVQGDEFRGSWKGFGVNGTFFLRRAEAKPKLYREEEVTFANRDVKLSGTILIPKGNGRFPAVVLVHGSSPNERTTYRSWARHFAENGIAALIYDKRGSGRSTGNTREASMQDLAADALAGISLLKLRRDVDAGKVGIAGHSQGGWIAPLAAAMSGDVAFVIVSGAAAVTPAEQSIFHRAGVMREAGIGDAEIAEATQLREKLYLLNRKILAGDRDVPQFREALSKELADRKGEKWFAPAELPPELNREPPPRGALDLLFFDAAPVWSKVKVPVLAMWGERDIVVPVEKSRGLIEEYLKRAGNADLTVKILPGLDHSNNRVADPGEWDFPRRSSEHDMVMVDWLKRKIG